jgi:hypothetical protein
MTRRECLYNTIHRNKKPLKAIAEEIGMSENYLTKAALPDPEESETGTGCRFPLKKLIPLIRTTEDFSVLDSIERSLGRVAVPIPPATPACLKDVCRLSLRAVREFGELMTEVEKSIADETVTEQELEQVRKEASHAFQAIVNLTSALERTRNEPRKKA